MANPNEAAPEPMPAEPDDHSLVTRTASGDRDAFAQLVRRHQGRVIALAHRFLGRIDAAEDVAQDAFIRVFQKAASYAPQAKFTTWLYRIVANLCWDARRARSRPPPPRLVGPAAAPSSGDALNCAEQRREIRAAVEHLPDRQRLVIILHRFEGLGHHEIAEITGWSRSAIESCLVRAYAELRSRLENMASGEFP